ncbi:hypothetical protein [Streptomyces sp. NPDC096132]|uniref:hypothetical protein n=1 Tax=Streptomyces sp. NPDC096132 TaxID=3366075 RepID=UPI0037F342B8
MTGPPLNFEAPEASISSELPALVRVWTPTPGMPLPGDQVPAAASSDQEGYWPRLTVVPRMVSGSQISCESPRSPVFQRSPAYK